MKKVLIVDDSPMVLNIIETALSLEDYDVVRAANADEALKKIEEGKFDFGIFDVNMPGKNCCNKNRYRWNSCWKLDC